LLNKINWKIHQININAANFLNKKIAKLRCGVNSVLQYDRCLLFYHNSSAKH